MNPSLRTQSDLADLAESQYGVVSHRQLEELGYSATEIKRATANRRLHAVHRTVFAVGHRGLSRRGKCLAGVLARGEGALLSHQSAAWLWGIEGSLDLPVEVSVHWRGHGRDNLRLHHCPALREADVAEFERIPVTAVPRTLLDRASSVKPWWLDRLLDRTERLDLLDVAEIDQLLDEVRGHRGRIPLLKALELYRDDGFFRSGGERRLLQLFRETGIPRPYVNTFVEGHEIDLFWEAEQFAVELDSWDAHRTPRSFEEDRKRHEDFALAEIEMIRITGHRLKTEPRQVAERLKILLGRRREDLRHRGVRSSVPIRLPSANATEGARGDAAGPWQSKDRRASRGPRFSAG